MGFNFTNYQPSSEQEFGSNGLIDAFYKGNQQAQQARFNPQMLQAALQEQQFKAQQEQQKAYYGHDEALAKAAMARRKAHIFGGNPGMPMNPPMNNVGGSLEQPSPYAFDHQDQASGEPGIAQQQSSAGMNTFPQQDLQAKMPVETEAQRRDRQRQLAAQAAYFHQLETGKAAPTWTDPQTGEVFVEANGEIFPTGRKELTKFQEKEAESESKRFEKIQDKYEDNSNIRYLYDELKDITRDPVFKTIKSTTNLWSGGDFSRKNFSGSEEQKRMIGRIQDLIGELSIKMGNEVKGNNGAVVSKLVDATKITSKDTLGQFMGKLEQASKNAEREMGIQQRTFELVEQGMTPSQAFRLAEEENYRLRNKKQEQQSDRFNQQDLEVMPVGSQGGMPNHPPGTPPAAEGADKKSLLQQLLWGTSEGSPEEKLARYQAVEDPWDELKQNFNESFVNAPATILNGMIGAGEWINGAMGGNKGQGMKAARLPYWENPLRNKDPSSLVGNAAAMTGQVAGSLPAAAAMSPLIAELVGSGVAGAGAGGRTWSQIGQNALSNAANAGTQGALLSQDNRLDNGLMAAGLAGLGTGLVQGAGKARSMSSKPLAQGIAKQVAETQSDFNIKYNAALGEGEKAGANEFLKPIATPKKTPLTRSAGSKGSTSYEGWMSELPKTEVKLSKPAQDLMKSGDKSYFGALEHFNKDPSLTKAHEAQSQMRKLQSKHQNAFAKHGHAENQQIAEYAQSIRNRIQVDMQEAFQKAGAEKAGKAYAELSPSYVKDYVEPYLNNPAIADYLNLNHANNKDTIGPAKFIKELLEHENREGLNPFLERFGSQHPDLVDRKYLQDALSGVKSVKKGLNAVPGLKPVAAGLAGSAGFYAGKELLGY